jgi:hypothetical protein
MAAHAPAHGRLPLQQLKPDVNPAISTIAVSRGNSMILRIAALLLAVLVGACGARPLPAATGPVRQLNVGKWEPGPGDLELPPAKPVRSGA